MGKKISELSELTTPAGGDSFAIVDVSDPISGTTKKITYANVSGIRSFGLMVYVPDSTLVAGTGIVYSTPMPSSLNGYNLTSIIGSVYTAGTAGTVTFDIQRGHQASPTSAYAFHSVFSTLPTIDVNEYCTKDATTQYVIDTSYDDISTGDIFRIDVPTSVLSAKGLLVTLTFTLP